MRPNALTKNSIAKLEMSVLIALEYAYQKRSSYMAKVDSRDWFHIVGWRLATMLYLR